MATIKDIAEAAGISVGTVDRIIHNRGRFSAETADKVRRAMAELNYTPNIHARGLKKTRGYTFGAVIPQRDQDAGYWQLVEEGILSAAAELSSYSSQVKLFPFDRYSSESCRSALVSAVNSGAQGLLIAPVRPEDVQAQLGEGDLPCLFIDIDMADMSCRVSFIGQDSLQSGILSGKLMNLLLPPASGRGGAKKVLIINPPGRNPHLGRRIEGFRRFMEDFRRDVSLIHFKEAIDDEDQFHNFMDTVFKNSAGRPDGIFVGNSSVYYMASYLEKRGGEFPRIPLIGYDLIPSRRGLIERGDH